MKIRDKEFEMFISATEIDVLVSRMADEVNADYAGKSLVVCPVLTGAYLFAADLVRKLKVDAEVRFVKYKSYEGMSSTGSVRCELPFPKSVCGKDVLIVEDVVDTGLSMEHLIAELKNMGVKSVRVCALFYKPMSFKGDYKVDYIGREIGNEFIVGYGMDYDEAGRTLPDVWVVKVES